MFQLIEVNSSVQVVKQSNVRLSDNVDIPCHTNPPERFAGMCWIIWVSMEQAVELETLCMVEQQFIE